MEVLSSQIFLDTRNSFALFKIPTFRPLVLLISVLLTELYVRSIGGMTLTGKTELLGGKKPRRNANLSATNLKRD